MVHNCGTSTTTPPEGKEHEGKLFATSYPHPTVDDTFDVRYILLKFLPLELADIIIEIAEYYPSFLVTYQESDMLKVSASQALDYDARYCCIVTPRIPMFAEGVTSSQETGCNAGDENQKLSAKEERPVPAFKKIKRVKFEVKGNDQGWVTVEGSIRDTYQGAKSWWEAFILRPSEASSAPALSPDLSETVTAESIHSAVFREHNLTEVTAGGKKQWIVQRNMVASSIVREYTVLWRDDDSNAVDEEKKELMTGSGCGTGFIDALKPGDRVAVLARAKEWGWENYVHGVSVEIMFSL